MRLSRTQCFPRKPAALRLAPEHPYKVCSDDGKNNLLHPSDSRNYRLYCSRSTVNPQRRHTLHFG